MDNKTVNERLIFLGIVGSHAYGTNLPDGISDFDYSGVCIPTKDYYIGTQKFDQANKWVDENGNKIDKTVYSFDKIIHLCIDNNPNCLDNLFLPERCIKFISKEWQKIIDIRESFISKKCKFTFSNYAANQLEKIQTHRAYLLSPVKEPTREQFQLPEKSIFPMTQVEIIAKLAFNYLDINNREAFYREVNQVVDNELMTIFRKFLDPSVVPSIMQEFKKGQTEYFRTFEAISSMYLKEEYISMAAREMKYITAYKNWKRYKDWQTNRNPKRQALEAKCGWDSKAGSHLFRLEKMGIEILEGKGVNVDRTQIDAEFLKEIRMGNHKFEDILEMSRVNQAKLDTLYITSKIPNRPDIKTIENVKMKILQDYLFKNSKIKNWTKKFFNQPVFNKPSK